jgi:hypothetical protein
MQKDDVAALGDAEDAIQAEIDSVTARFDRLMTGYLDKLYGADEYRTQKAGLLNEKQAGSEKLAAIRKTRSSRFEPEIRFVNALKQADSVATDGNPEKQRDFFKMIGSNPKLVNRTLRFVPRHAWELVVDQAPVAQHTTAPTHFGAVTVGKPSHVLTKAVSMGHASNVFRQQSWLEIVHNRLSPHPSPRVGRGFPFVLVILQQVRSFNPPPTPSGFASPHSRDSLVADSSLTKPAGHLAEAARCSTCLR